MKKRESLLWVDIREAKENKMFAEEQRAAIRFLLFSAPVACAHCGKKKKKMWTMLCAFRSTPELNEVGMDLSVGNKSLPPLSPVCTGHCLYPDYPEPDAGDNRKQRESKCC